MAPLLYCHILPLFQNESNSRDESRHTSQSLRFFWDRGNKHQFTYIIQTVTLTHAEFCINRQVVNQHLRRAQTHGIFARIPPSKRTQNLLPTSLAAAQSHKLFSVQGTSAQLLLSTILISETQNSAFSQRLANKEKEGGGGGQTQR